jgi:ABC-type uncharacterized transport system permease subunit
VLLVSLIAILLYGAGSALLLLEVLKRFPKLTRYATLFLVTGFGLDTIELIASFSHALMTGRVPVTGPADYYSVFGWVCMAIVVLVRLQFRLPAIAGFFAPVGFALSALSFMLPESREPLAENLPGYLFAAHIAMVFVSLGIFCLAFLAALIYLLEHRQLKMRRFGKIFAIFPPLDALDRLTVRAMVLGVTLLTAAILTGIYLAHSQWPKSWVYNPKFLFSVATWVWYVLILSLRYFAGWRGGRFFALIVVAFCFLIVTFLGVTAFFPSPAGHRSVVDLPRIGSWRS